MCANLIIFVVLCLAFQVRPGHTQTYAAASSKPPPTDHSTPPDQYYSETTQNDYESSDILIDEYGTVEHDGFNKTNEVSDDEGIEETVTSKDIVYEEVAAVEDNEEGFILDYGETNYDNKLLGSSNKTKNTIGQMPPNHEPAFAYGGRPVPNFETQKLTGEQMVWHVGIYSQWWRPFMQICGGTLVKSNAVISAAHCFWSDKGVQPASHYAVGASKRYRPWNEKHDKYGQKSNVKAIHVPVRYRDVAANYQEDIAVVLLKTYFNSNYAVPVCVNFDKDFDNEQLMKGNMGTILGWGLTEENGNPSQVLNYVELPSVSIEECLDSADAIFLRYLTSDKICAGVTTGKALCKGDSGGGLIFFDKVGPTRVPYLRAVASAAPSKLGHKCNTHALAALTHLRTHRDFLRQHIPGLEATCTEYYPHAYDHHDRFHKQKAESLTTGQSDQPATLKYNCFYDINRETAIRYHPIEVTLYKAGNKK